MHTVRLVDSEALLRSTQHVGQCRRPPVGGDVSSDMGSPCTVRCQVIGYGLTKFIARSDENDDLMIISTARVVATFHKR